MSDATEMYSTPAEPAPSDAPAELVEAVETIQTVESIEPAEPTEAAEAAVDTKPPPALPNDTVLSSALGVYRDLLQQLVTNKQTIQTTRHELAEVRQQIRDLSALSKREPHVEDDADSHGLHTSKVAAQYDDCGSIIAYAEQVRRHVYDNINEAEALLSPMTQSVDLLKLRVHHIRLLENLLSAQEQGLRLEIQQRNADACIWQLADILKV
ncbi:hypothetical protein J9253_05560 [Thiothrix litoralis]|uniref:Uncharacterized protein n=1 Tax=Thiothrix litoralis TaxID=2891210 RepID=A0ABX7WYE4_9GAMM|nr:hypothetical protein [Thiothrix litoralis]QTR47403.1 hypothetical protein J9253_05560 [Thiothrix litoralis]